MFTYKHLLYNMSGKLQSTTRNLYSRKYQKKFVITKKVYPENTVVPESFKYSNEDARLIELIQTETTLHNRNNITRTQAYKEIYFNHKELHWALLAHMVSRNSGWLMTDLKGELLPHLMTEQERYAMFRFYETANALIFQDAYPQLLLYVESKRRQINLFHLLPAFHVSRFMKPFWDLFLKDQDSVLITTALIMNEQHYIEDRVIQNEKYQQTVLETLKFKGQEIAQMTQVIFPYEADNLHIFWTRSGTRLAGLILEHFADVKERIAVGKKLYAMLFGIKDVFEGVTVFAENVFHSGSRKDYWDYLFTDKVQYKHSQYQKERMIGEKKIKQAPPFYSPTLEEAWENQSIPAVSELDWYNNTSVLKELQDFSVPMRFDMTGEYCFGLNKLELAVLSKRN
ncbi:DUF2515 family protein [Salibacterium salarium]|nr:DUF2515 family protein [Salibacterium salarium]